MIATTLLFDIDGTLLDTREFILQATEHTLRQFDLNVPDRDTLSKMVGKPFPEFYQILAERSDVADLVATHRAFQLEHLDLSVPFPNTIETLHALKERGYRLATVSTRSKITTHETLKLAGIDHYFDVCISGEDTPEKKPHPAPLLLALERLQSEPHDAVMIGDSDFDVEAGKNAGTQTVRVSYGFHTEKMHDTNPDAIIHDIKELLTILS